MNHFALSFNVPAPTAVYTLSLHDALPISLAAWLGTKIDMRIVMAIGLVLYGASFWMISAVNSDWGDRKSTRLNSSHVEISYAVFCLKKKKNQSTGVLAGSPTPVNLLN